MKMRYDGSGGRGWVGSRTKEKVRQTFGQTEIKKERKVVMHEGNRGERRGRQGQTERM